MSRVEEIQMPSPEGVYPIFVGTLTALPPLPIVENARGVCAIITNPRVGALYASRVVAALRAQNFDPRVIEIPEGETYKTLDTVRVVYDRLIDARLDRRSVIFALGGGVVGDLAGFVAATFLRGVPFVQMPTTLLAMVDASVGGKVAVDHPRGKNLIGAFKQPRAVLADLTTLATLPDCEWQAGMAEVVKHGIIGDARLFAQLEVGNWKLEIANWIGRAIRVKVDVVTRDPFEQGERGKLNLGHTFGHAFELLSQYKLQHGEAVAIGLVCAARLSERRGTCAAGLADRIENLLRAIGLPTRVLHGMTIDAILAAMATDKKRVAARLRFVLPRALGDVVIVDDVTREEIVGALGETC
jgi:3-dehydroquinate synthase